jgi:hypothetical protein
MRPHRKELILSRIIAGCLRINYEKSYLYVRQPTREHKYIANEIYEETLRECELEGLYNDDELLDFLIEYEIWDEDKQKLLDGVQKDIETIKIKLFNLAFKEREREMARKMLVVAKKTVYDLIALRNSKNDLSCAGVAQTAKSKYLLGVSLYYQNNERVFPDDYHLWITGSNIIEDVANFYFQNHIQEEDYREISRTEPWRSTWNAKRGEGKVFGLPSADLSDEQRVLIIWSGIYDSIYEHPECPPDEVVEDNDMIDGWMLIQRNKRRADLDNKRGLGAIENEKIKNSDEVYFPVNTLEDAKKVDTLNDDHAMLIKRKRIRLLREKGTVNEVEMPDTLQKLHMEANKLRGK